MRTPNPFQNCTTFHLLPSLLLEFEGGKGKIEALETSRKL
jgi:hypothetical protein